MHHPLLHNEHNEQSKRQASGPAKVSAHHTNADKPCELFRILPVKLYHGSRCLQVYAFLDEGSSATLIDAKVLRKLEIDGIAAPLCLRWTNDVTRSEPDSVRASIQISATSSSHKFWLNDVQSVENLSLARQTIDMESLQRKFSFLAGLPIQSYVDVSPMLLIGTNNWKLAVPRKLREGKWDEPIATKCMLGWSIQGGRNTQSARLNIHRCSCDWEKLHEEVKNSFNLEPVSSRSIISDEEQRSMRILDETCQRTGGKYEVGLLWKNDEVAMPESYGNALKRANGLRQKMQREPALKATVDERIENLLSKGYAREVTKDELNAENPRVWYMPIFVTRNPNKPNKVRLVWDAAAKVNGKSLNDFMMTGPDMLKPLCDVLLAFRVGDFAICGDIAEMFHRINIRDTDMHAQRFLFWRDGDKMTPSTFVMKAMTFGISCAPCIAHYVRNKNTVEFEQEYPRACEAIREAHYVDDLVDSMHSEEDIIKLAKDVRHIHAAGGFTIRNWTSNSTRVVLSLQDKCDEIQAPVALDDSAKVLGMYWDPNKDVFKYICGFARLKRDVFGDDTAPTKRETLQVLMSIFDPLGFLAPYTIDLKILLQRIWQLGCGWDEVIPSSTHSAWREWKEVLHAISNIEIPRCYSPLLFGASDVQIHTFVDASETAYAAACYLRVQSGNHVTVLLVAAKAKVAPLKPLSVPRLELQAAVIGARLTQKVINTRNLRTSKHVYWSDSKTVLRWLRMDPRTFNQFVMFRVGELLEVSDARQWRWVPSKLNPADLATKVQRIDTQMWLRGPDFLKDDESAWPTCTDLGPADQCELRKYVLHIRAEAPVKFYVEYFSNWKRLYRSVALWILYVAKCRSRATKISVSPNLTFEQLQKAKTLLYKEAQRSTFPLEIRILESGQQIERRSPLAPLNVYLDDDGVLRMQGRAQCISNKDAIFLPKSHYVTQLIVRSYH